MGESKRIKERLQQKAAYAGIPISGTFELTPRCNFQCHMCYVRMTEAEMKPFGRELTAKEWISLGEQATEAGMVFLLLTGGEPTLRPDFLQIYDALSRMGLSVSINTNGSLFNSQTRALFAARPPAQLNVTLYGPDAETYAAMCGNPNAFSKTMDTLRWARDAGILLNVNLTVTPWNVGLIGALENLAEREKLHLRLTFYNFPPARREEKTEFARLPAEEVGRLIAQRQLRLEGAEKICRVAESIDHATATRLGEHACEAQEGGTMRCFAGRSQFWVTWNGSMTPCGMLNTPVTAPQKVGFLPAWEELRRQTAQIRLCTDCLSCKERDTCFNCGAVMLSETESYQQRPDYMCRLNHAYREEIHALAEQVRLPK